MVEIRKESEIITDVLKERFEEVKQAWSKSNGYAPIRIYEWIIADVLSEQFDYAIDRESAVNAWLDNLVAKNILKLSESYDSAVLVG